MLAGPPCPTAGHVAKSYRVIAITPGLAQTTMRVTAESVTIRQRRTTDSFLVNRVEVREETELGI